MSVCGFKTVVLLPYCQQLYTCTFVSCGKPVFFPVSTETNADETDKTGETDAETK